MVSNEPKVFERSLEVGWRFGLEVNGTLADWMFEGEDGRVKRLTAERVGKPSQGGVSNRPAVERIAKYRVPVLGQMHADLVRPTGLQTTTHQAGSPQRLERLQVCDRPASSIGSRGVLLSIDGMPRMECVVGDRGRRSADDDGEVAAIEIVSLERLHQALMGERCLGDDHDAARVFVEPVYDARANRVSTTQDLGVM